MIIQDFVPLLFVVAILVGFHFLRLKLMGATVTSDELAERMKVDDVKVIDVRSAPEYHGDMGHIPGAVNLPLAELNAKLKAMGAEIEPLKGVPVFLMCRTDNRAAHAVRYLKKAGFTNLSVIKGGIKAWDRAGLPVEKTAA